MSSDVLHHTVNGAKVARLLLLPRTAADSGGGGGGGGADDEAPLPSAPHSGRRPPHAHAHLLPAAVASLSTFTASHLVLGVLLLVVAVSSTLYALLGVGRECGGASASSGGLLLFGSSGPPPPCPDVCGDNGTSGTALLPFPLAGAAATPPRQIVTDFAPWALYGVTTAAMRKTLAANRPSRDGMAVHAVTIKDGFLYFNEADLEAEVDTGLFDKTKLFAEQVTSVLAAAPLPDVTFLMTSSSLPFLTDMPADPLARIGWSRRRAPVFSIAKAEGHGDVLMPNPYFGSLPAWDREVGKLLRRAEKVSAGGPAAWAKRVPKLHWRGSCSTKFDGVLPRLLVLLTWGEYPGFDIAFSNQCLSRMWAPYHPTKVLSAAQIRATAGLHRRRVEVEELSKFKALLHLPGASSGSYSRSLQYQLTAGAALLKYDNPYREFYYSEMLEGVHYLSVNLTSVGDVWEWLRENDDAAAALGAGALKFASTHLRAAHISAYWRALFRAYAALQRFPVELPARPCICPGVGPGVEALLTAHPVAARLPRCRLISSKC